MVIFGETECDEQFISLDWVPLKWMNTAFDVTAMAFDRVSNEQKRDIE